MRRRTHALAATIALAVAASLAAPLAAHAEDRIEHDEPVESATLEVALAMINDRMGALPATLESLHLTSEEHETEATRRDGRMDLETSQTVIP